MSEGLKINAKKSMFHVDEDLEEESFEERAIKTMENMTEREASLVAQSTQYIELLRKKTNSENHTAQLKEVEQRNRSRLVSLMRDFNNDPDIKDIDEGTRAISMLLMRADEILNYKVNDALFNISEVVKTINNMSSEIKRLQDEVTSLRAKNAKY